MPSHDRRAAARRRAWGRGPMILRFEPLEGRQLMAGVAAALPDLATTSFSSSTSGDWDGAVQVSGTVANIGTTALESGTVAAIYASPTNAIGGAALLLGTVPINAGLAPGASQPFAATFALPPSPLSGMGMNSQLFIDTDIDPQNLVAEANKSNNQGQGLGLDESIVSITPQPMANLIGTAFDVSPAATAWGQPISVTLQVKDNGQGPAPATRAKIVLTPNGQAPGGAGDITIGNLAVPVLLPFQTVNLVQQITLPATPPATLGNAGTYYISAIEDADHLTSPLVAQVNMQGLGLDEQTISIPYPTATAAASTTTTTTASDGTTTSTTTTASTAMPDLAPSTISLPVSTFNWGQGYVVTTAVENLGQAPSTPTTILFALTGDTDNPSQGYYLGSSTIPALAPGAVQDIAQTIKLPSRLPFGTDVAATSFGRIMAIVDPENIINETSKNNNDIQSGPVTLQLLWGGANSIVPTSPPIRTSQPTTAATTPAPATTTAPVITAKDALIQARKARAEAKAKPPAKASLAANIAAQLRAEKAAAARARAAKVAAQKVKKGNSLVRALINYQNNTNNSIINVLKLLK